MLSLKGDTRGQKEQIMNELIKVHQRFQARIHEYQILLKMTIQFFKNLDQVSKTRSKVKVTNILKVKHNFVYSASIFYQPYTVSVHTLSNY